MEKQKITDRQSNFEKEKSRWGNQTSCLQNVLPSCSHQKSMVLA